MESSCTHSIEADTVYKGIGELGVEYWNIFKGLKNLRYGPRSAVGTVLIPDTAALMPHQFESDLVIQPVLFDTLTQILWVDLLIHVTEPYLPSYIKSISVSRGLSKQTGDTFRTFARRTSEITPNQYTASIAAIDVQQGNKLPAVEFEGMVLSRIANIKPEPKGRDVAFRPEWKPLVNFIPKYRHLEIFSEPMTTTEETKCQEHELASLYFIEAALAKVKVNQPHDLKDHYRQCYKWMEAQYMVAKARAFNGRTDQVHVACTNPEEILQQASGLSAEGQLIGRLGHKLPEILRGEVDLIAVMEEGNLLERYLDRSMSQSHVWAARYVDLLAHQNPHLKVLEIGGWTEPAIPIVQKLGVFLGEPVRFLRYDFTATSPSVLNKAKTRFSDYRGDSINYLEFDVEQDPSSQGLQIEDYDVVIVSEFVSATTNPEQSLKNVRKLLRPEGRLVLIEQTQMTLRTFPLALLPRSWSSTFSLSIF